MKTNNIFFFFIFFYSCKVPQKTLNTSTVDIWKQIAIEQFVSKYDKEKFGENRGGTIYEFCMRELERIEPNEQKRIFDNVMKNIDFEKWSEMIIIYHYIESSSNFNITTVLVYDDNICKGQTYSYFSEEYNSVKNCELFPKVMKSEFTSHFLDNGILIYTKYNRNFEILDFELDIGVAIGDLNKILKFYDIKY